MNNRQITHLSISLEDVKFSDDITDDELMVVSNTARSLKGADLEAERAISLASDAMRLASLAAARVSSSRASRLRDDILFNQSDVHCSFCADHLPDESIEETESSPKDSNFLINAP